MTDHYFIGDMNSNGHVHYCIKCDAVEGIPETPKTCAGVKPEVRDKLIAMGWTPPSAEFSFVMQEPKKMDLEDLKKMASVLGVAVVPLSWPGASLEDVPVPRTAEGTDAELDEALNTTAGRLTMAYLTRVNQARSLNRKLPMISNIECMQCAMKAVGVR